MIKKNNDVLGITSYYWLGLTKTASTWVRENEGDAEFTHWYPGKPNSLGNNGPRNYVELLMLAQ